MLAGKMFQGEICLKRFPKIVNVPAPRVKLRLVVHLPLRPHRASWIVVGLPCILVASAVLYALMLLHTRHGVANSSLALIFDLALHGAVFLATREELEFNPSGIERLAGVRRGYIAYSEVQSVQLRRVEAQPPVLWLNLSDGKQPVKIRFDFYKPGEGLRMLQVLREHAARAQWDESATSYGVG